LTKCALLLRSSDGRICPRNVPRQRRAARQPRARLAASGARRRTGAGAMPASTCSAAIRKRRGSAKERAQHCAFERADHDRGAFRRALALRAAGSRRDACSGLDAVGLGRRRAAGRRSVERAGGLAVAAAALRGLQS
jgi:hypothetical protein